MSFKRSKTNDSLEINLNNFCSVLLPRKNRKAIGLSIPDEVDIDLSIRSINTSLQSVYKNSLISILESKFIGNNSKESLNNYEVIFLVIPNEFINKLKTFGYKSFQAFVGFDENQEEYKILNNEPDDHEIAFKNLEGILSPFKSCIYNLN